MISAAGDSTPGHRFRTAVLTVLALVAFAANSLLCRLALRTSAIDPVSFTAVRLASGAAMLWLIAVLSGRRRQATSRGSWTSALMLFAYAAAFSFAYLSLSVGTGALILFGAVQGTMMIAGIRAGERPHPMQWAGLVAALGGLIYLVSPGLTAPSPAGSGLMAAAGIAWGVYSLRGRGAGDPLTVTVDNFMRSVPLVLIISLLLMRDALLTQRGIVLAACSGAVTSGVGYVLWYAALKGLTTTRAAVVQLAVPVIAAFVAALFLDEPVPLRLVAASVMILGGIALAVRGKARPPAHSRS
jgi:drug/metabolite transporter (DMT)-like permease